MCKNWLKNTFSSINLKKGEVITSLLLLSLGAMAVGSFLGIRELQKDGKMSVFTRADSCSYSSTVTLKDEQGRTMNISGNQLGVSLRSQFTANGKQYDSTEYFQNGTNVKMGQQLTEGFQNVPVSLTLNVDPNRYEIVSNFCDENPPGNGVGDNACGSSGTGNRMDVRLFCGKTVNYGWTLRLKTVDPTACLFDSKAILKDEQGRLISDPTVSVNSSFTTIVAGGKDYTGTDPFTTGQVVKLNTVVQPQFQDVAVQLKVTGLQNKYDLVSTFCTDSTKNASSSVTGGTACASFAGDTVNSALRCNKAVEYGWVVRPKAVSPTPTAGPAYVSLVLDETKPNPYYSCYSKTNNINRAFEKGGMTSQGKITCSGSYNAATDTLETIFKQRDPDAGPFRITANMYRCTSDGSCSTRPIPERYIGEGRELRGEGDQVVCQWVHPFSSSTLQDINCSAPGTNGFIPTPTIPPAGSVRGTVDSILVAHSTGDYYVSRSVDGCPFVAPVVNSLCPANSSCNVLPAINPQASRTGIEIASARPSQLNGITRYMGCPCNPNMGLPGKGFCAPEFNPASTQRMEPSFCFGGQDPVGVDSSIANRMTCTFTGQRCSFSSHGTVPHERCGGSPVGGTGPTAAPVPGAPVCAASSKCIYPQQMADEAGHSDLKCFIGRCKAGYETCGGINGEGISEYCTYAGDACGVRADEVTCPGFPTLTPTGRPPGGGGGGPAPTARPANPGPTTVVPTVPAPVAQQGSVSAVIYSPSANPNVRWLGLAVWETDDSGNPTNFLGDFGGGVGTGNVNHTETVSGLDANKTYRIEPRAKDNPNFNGGGGSDTTGVAYGFISGSASNCRQSGSAGNNNVYCNIRPGSNGVHFSVRTLSTGGQNPVPTQPGQPGGHTGTVTGRIDIQGLPPERWIKLQLYNASSTYYTPEYFTNGETFTYRNVPYGNNTLLVNPFLHDRDGIPVSDSDLRITNCAENNAGAGNTCDVNVTSAQTVRNLTVEISNISQAQPTRTQPGPTGTPGNFSWSGYLDIPEALAVTGVDLKWYSYNAQNAGQNHGAGQLLGQLTPNDIDNVPGFKRYNINVDGLASNKLVLQIRAKFQSTGDNWYTFENCNSDGFCPVIDTTQGVRGFNLIDLSRPRDITLPIYLDYFVPNLNINAEVRKYDETQRNNRGDSVAIGNIVPDSSRKAYLLRFTTSGLPEAKYYVRATMQLGRPFNIPGIGTVNPFTLQLPCDDGWCLVDSTGGNIRINLNIPIEMTSRNFTLGVDLTNHPLKLLVNAARTARINLNSLLRGYAYYYNENDGSMGGIHAEGYLTEHGENNFTVTLPRFANERYYVYGEINLPSILVILPDGLTVRSPDWILDLRQAPNLEFFAIQFGTNTPFTPNASSDLNSDGIINAQDFLTLVRQSGTGGAKAGTALKISTIFKDTGKKIVDKDDLQEVIQFYKEVERKQREAGLIK